MLSMELDKAKLLAALEGVEHTEVIMYGSYAYGSPGPESDLDILVVSKQGLGLRKASELEERLEQATGVKVDLHAFTEERMANDAPWSTMIPDAVTRGIVLSPEGRRRSIYEGLAKEWSAAATARFYVASAEVGRRRLHRYGEKWRVGADADQDTEEVAEERAWERIFIEGKVAGMVRQATWAVLWSADDHFSKQDVAKLTGDGKWAHWSLPSLLKALKVVAPESYDRVAPFGEALLEKETWRTLLNDTKAAQNTLKQLVPSGEIEDLVAKAEAFLDAAEQEVARNLGPEMQSLEATLA